MYTNNNRSVLGFIVKVLFFIAFVFLLMYLFPTKNDLKPLLSNQFRENINYMQEVAKSYFTTDKLPKDIGESVKITLKDMTDQKLIIPFVDKDNNSCNMYESYAEIIKEEKGYKLKIQLTCGEESDYIYEILGCYDYGCDCSSEEKETVISYLFKRNYDKKYTTYSCPEGYSKDGKFCYKKLIDTKDATKVYNQKYIDIVDAKYTNGEVVRVKLDTIVTKKEGTVSKKYVDSIVTKTTGKTVTIELQKIIGTIKGATYDCSYVTQECNTYSKPTYKCNCVQKFVGGKYVTSCDTCGGGSYTSCSDIDVKKTCQKPDSISYTCPAGTTSQTGSGSSLRCYKSETSSETVTYSCPKDIDGSEGQGPNLKCYYLVKSPDIVTYSCPKEATIKIGSGANLTCFYTFEGEKKYYCEDSSYTLNKSTKKCSKEKGGEFLKYACASGYINKNDGSCYKEITEKINAKASTYTKTITETKWSSEKYLPGWIFTGETKIVELN